MATYKGIQGYSVQKLATDPSGAGSVGQLWYNSTAGAFKYTTQGAGAWSSGSALNVGREEIASAGTATAALCIGGYTAAPGAAHVKSNELYDGTTWTEVADLVTAKSAMEGCGTQTAALIGAGGPAGIPASSDSWDGTSWTVLPNMVRTPPSGANMAAGTTTAAVFAFGAGSGSPYTTLSETWNGSAWSEGTNGNTARQGLWGFGTSTAALASGGATPPMTAKTELYDGTSWTEVNLMNTARGSAGGCAGTQSDGLACAGEVPPTSNATETWDGTSWTTVANLANATKTSGGSPAGSSSAALSVGGAPLYTPTEVWADPVYTIKTVTVS